MLGWCSMPACGGPISTRGWCNKHYQRWRRHGSPDTVITPRRSQPCAMADCLSLAGIHGWCDSHGLRMRRFGVSGQRFAEMVELQGSCCAICGVKQHPVDLVIDHDHRCCDERNTCGDCIRGLLCARCNAGIGMLLDNPESLRRAADYLESQAPLITSGLGRNQGAA